MSWFEQMIDYVVFIAAFVGNFFILILLFVNRKRWKSMDVYVYSLAVFDFVYTFGIPVRIYVRWQDGHWPFGSWMCKLYCGLDSLTMSVSINILVIMCADRFLAIKRPFRTTSERVFLNAILKVLIALVVSTAMTSPMFFLSHVTLANFTGPKGTNSSFGSTYNESQRVFSLAPNEFTDYPELETSYEPLGTGGNLRNHERISQFDEQYFPLETYTSLNISSIKSDLDGIEASTRLSGGLRCYLKPPNNQQKIYFVFQYLSIFVIPGALLTWLYLEMLREFRTVTNVLYENGNVRINQPAMASGCQSVNERMVQLNLERKRKVTRIILIIIILFMICYLPFCSMVLVQMFLKSSPWRKSWYKILHFIFVTLTYLNSCANPFLYTLLCKRYRIIFVKYFPCRTVNCYCLLPATSDPTPTIVKNRRENLVYSARRKPLREVNQRPIVIQNQPLAQEAEKEQQQPVELKINENRNMAVAIFHPPKKFDV